MNLNQVEIKSDIYRENWFFIKTMSGNYCINYMLKQKPYKILIEVYAKKQDNKYLIKKVEYNDGESLVSEKRKILNQEVEDLLKQIRVKNE